MSTSTVISLDIDVNDTRSTNPTEMRWSDRSVVLSWATRCHRTASRRAWMKAEPSVPAALSAISPADALALASDSSSVLGWPEPNRIRKFSKAALRLDAAGSRLVIVDRRGSTSVT